MPYTLKKNNYQRFRTNNGDAGTLTSIERIYRQNGVQVGPMVNKYLYFF